MRSPGKVRVNLTASSQPARRASGFLSPTELARFDWRLAVGDVVLTDDELAELAAAKEPFIRVAGKWHALRRSDVERALRFLDRRRAGAGIVDLVRAVSGLETDEAGVELGEVTLDAPLASLLDDGEQRFRSRPTPAAMQFELFPFQERGHGWLRMLGDLGVGAILADDMGLGKTVQAIAMLASEREDFERDALGPTLVVCPMSVVKQWGAEIARFAPSLRVHLHHGTGRLTGAALTGAAHTHDVVVTSYDIATRDIDTLALVTWDRLLLDEAQDVKNPATKRARALRRLPARRKLAMTGTPIENRLGELWAIMDIVNPGLLGSRDWFERTFAKPIESFGNTEALERLRSIVQPFILRRPKDSPEVELELPPITIAKDYCRLTVEQASLYRATVDRWLARVEAHHDRFGRRGAVLAMLSQLKQVCNHPEMVVATGQPLDGRSGKLDRLLELLELVPAGDKALVFTQYPGFDRLVPHLEQQLGKSVGFFHGRLNARQREDLLASFATEEGPTVLVISIRAGGRGLNLPAANHVIHFDRWWNPAVEQQATDRAHRFGQRKHVFVHSLISTGTLEERIDQMLESKRELAESVIAGRAEDWLGDLDLGAIRAAVELSVGPVRGGGRMSERLGRGPWARLLVSAVLPDEGSSVAERGRVLVEEDAVQDLVVTSGTVSARIDGCDVTIATEPVPPRIWAAMTRYAREQHAARGGRGRTCAVGAARAPDDGGLGAATRSAHQRARAGLHLRSGRRVRAPRRARLCVRARDRPQPGDAAALARVRGSGGERAGGSRRAARHAGRRLGGRAAPRAASAPAAADRCGAEAPRPERAAGRRNRPRRAAAAGVRLVRRLSSPLALRRLGAESGSQALAQARFGCAVAYDLRRSRSSSPGRKDV